MKNGSIQHRSQLIYIWLLSRYAKEGDKILDTHVGSASSLIACRKLGYDYVGCEKNSEIYYLANKRIQEYLC